jgi:hypothetical protein
MRQLCHLAAVRIDQLGDLDVLSMAIAVAPHGLLAAEVAATVTWLAELRSTGARYGAPSGAHRRALPALRLGPTG